MNDRAALAASVRAIGLIGPGFDDWAGARAVLRGEAPWAMEATRIPNPDILPPAERRRVGAVVKLALGVGMQALRGIAGDATQVATVFASGGGDGANCHTICAALAGDDRLISPTRFHNSVNNAASGNWGIATGAMASSTIVSAYDGSFSAGLLEALALARSLQQPVLLVAYDHPYPAPLDAARRLLDAFGVAMLLDPHGGAAPRLQLQGFTADACDLVADGALEPLRRGTPAARSLPLLAMLAQGRSGRVVLDYLDGVGLALELDA